MNDIDILLPLLSPNHKYYWRNRISRHHILHMLSLAPLNQLIGDVNGVPDSRYLMHRVETLLSPDGARRYEFLIEYDIYNPSQCIYFGCKSVTMPDHRHEKEIIHANEDWQRVKPHVLLRLNNTFVDKDFSFRFKETDNANDSTFWPFWISLYEDEDPKRLAVKTLSIIASTYRQLFSETLPQISVTESPQRKTTIPQTAFTEEAYNRLRDSIQTSVKVASALIKEDSSQMSKPLLAWYLFEDFLVKAEANGILHSVNYYEKAWMIDRVYSDVDFKCMISLLFQQLSERLEVESIRIPWSSLIRIFLRSDGTPFKQHIKTINITPSTLRYWSSLLQTIYKPEY